MKSFKKLIGTVLGGIGALTGISMLMNACNEDQNNKPVVEVTAEEVQQCCGTDQTNPAYSYCVNRYIYSGNCITSDSLQECCGTKESGDNYTICVRDYIETGFCSGSDDWTAPVYGMPDQIIPDPDIPDEEEFFDCCGQDTGTALYKECIEQFYSPNGKEFCIILPEPDDEGVALYGPPPDNCCGYNYPDDDFDIMSVPCFNVYLNTGICPYDIGYGRIDDCCGKIRDEKTLTACVKDYLKSGECPFSSDAKPVYGMPDDPDE